MDTDRVGQILMEMATEADRRWAVERAMDLLRLRPTYPQQGFGNLYQVASPTSADVIAAAEQFLAFALGKKPKK